MTPEQFAYWMQGFVELNGGVQPTVAQWASIVSHLKTVFHKVTPQVAAQEKQPDPLADVIRRQKEAEDRARTMKIGDPHLFGKIEAQPQMPSFVC